MLFSKAAVTNSLMDKLSAKCKIKENPVVSNENKIKADSLVDRLNLMKNWR